MSDYRIRYGWAIGPEGTYAANSALTLITPGDTTPDVSNGVLFYTNNTSATAISYFDVVGPGGGLGVSEHQTKCIRVFFRDSLTTVNNSGQIFLASSQGALAANTIMDFLFHNSAWYETGRSVNAQNAQEATPVVKSVSYSFSGTAPVTLLNVTTADRLYITVSAAASVVAGFAGGRSSQTLDMIIIGIGSSVFASQSAGVLQIPGTSAVLLSNSGTYRFHTYDGVLWSMAPPLTP